MVYFFKFVFFRGREISLSRGFRFSLLFLGVKFCFYLFMGCVFRYKFIRIKEILFLKVIEGFEIIDLFYFFFRYIRIFFGLGKRFVG